MLIEIITSMEELAFDLAARFFSHLRRSFIQNKGVLFSLQGKNGSLGNGFDGGDKSENGREDGKHL